MRTPCGGIPASGDNALSQEMIGCVGRAFLQDFFQSLEVGKLPVGCEREFNGAPFHAGRTGLLMKARYGSSASPSDDALAFSNVARRCKSLLAGSRSGGRAKYVQS